MPLNPPQGYRNTENTHRRGERADQPLASDVLVGTLYYVTDEGITEQSDGADWAIYSGAGSRLSYVVNYSYSVNTASPPGTNQVRMDAGFPYTAVTKLYFDDVTADGQDVHIGLMRVSPGSLIYVQDKNDNTQYATFLTTGFPVDHTTWVEYDVTHYAHGAAIGGGQLVLVQSTWGPVTLPVFTPDSVPFSDGSGVLTEDNPDFVYDSGTDTLSAPEFAGGGAALTDLNGTEVTTGTVADARLSSNIPLKNTANTFTGIITNTAQPSTYVTNSGTQTLTTGVPAAIAFNTEAYDVGGCHDNATNNSRLTVPTGGDGTYMMCGVVTYDANSAGLRAAAILYNGATGLASIVVNAVIGDITSVQATALRQMVAGDYVELLGLQTSGGNLNAQAGCNFAWVKVW